MLQVSLTKQHRQITNCSSFFTGIEKFKTKRSSQNTNRLPTHIEVEHEIVKQSSQRANGLVLDVQTTYRNRKWYWVSDA